MPKKTKKYEDSLFESLRNSEEAAVYLNEALTQIKERNGVALFLLALRDVASANGMTEIANKISKSRTSLYKSLSKNGDPKFTTINVYKTASMLIKDIDF